MPGGGLTVGIVGMRAKGNWFIGQVIGCGFHPDIKNLPKIGVPNIAKPLCQLANCARSPGAIGQDDQAMFQKLLDGSEMACRCLHVRP